MRLSAEQQHFAASGIDQAKSQPHQRGFPTPVWSEQRNEIALLHCETDILDHIYGFVAVSGVTKFKIDVAGAVAVSFVDSHEAHSRAIFSVFRLTSMMDMKSSPAAI